jgi:transposase
MFTVELYAKIRRAVMVEGLSRREAAKRFGVHRNTITKMLSFSVPPGYRRRERPASKKLGPHMAWIEAILESDSQVHKKQRHTANRIFERLRDEQGFTGSYTIVREYVAAALLRRREIFVPLSHRPGHAQADFGEADGTSVGRRFASIIFAWICLTRMAASSRRIRLRQRKPSAMVMWRRSSSSAAYRNRFFTTTASWRWPRS